MFKVHPTQSARSGARLRLIVNIAVLHSHSDLEGKVPYGAWHAMP